MNEIDAELAAMFPDPPWRMPSALEAPGTGDRELDALLLTLDRSPADGNAIDASQKRLLSDARRENIRAAVSRWLDRITAEPPPTLSLRKAALKPAALARANTLLVEARAAWNQRAWLTQNLIAIHGQDADPSARGALLKWLLRSGDPRQRSQLGGALLAPIPKAEAAACKPILDELAVHLVAGDPLAPFAAEALVLRDHDDARPTIKQAMDTADDYTKAAIAVRVSKRNEIDFDRSPDWVDVIYPNVLGKPWAIEASYRLHTVTTAEPILRALAYTEEEPYWADLLEQLRRVDDVASAVRLEAMATTLSAAPKGKRLQRSSGTVLALVKHLRRKRDVVTKASFELAPGMGTDGGPILVVSKDAAAAWRGVPADSDGGAGADSDYDRACASCKSGIGTLKVDGRPSIVIDEQSVQPAALAGAAVLLVLHGTELEVEAALREPRAWKKSKATLYVGEGGAVLLDAARTLASAQDDAVAPLSLAPGRYQVSEIARADAAGRLRVLKLEVVPPKKKATKP